MKKVLFIIFCINFMNVCAFGNGIDISKSADGNKNQPEIQDILVDTKLDKNLKIKPYIYEEISDQFAEKNKKKNIISKTQVDYKEFYPQNVNTIVPREFFNIDYEEMQPIQISIKDYFSTRKKVQEGEYIDFITTNNVKINNQIYPKGTKVNGRIETISPNDFMGIPADIVISNFTIDNIKILGEINKTGANRTLWVYPLSSGTMGFFGIGILFVFIKGGHAKIKSSDIYTFYVQK
ncbi:hypothetical protein IJG14_07570 [bacterium]|nr:hypothetical protein [bacterium]